MNRTQRRKGSGGEEVSKDKSKLTRTPRNADLNDKDAASVRVELESRREPRGTAGKQPGSFSVEAGCAASAALSSALCLGRCGVLVPHDPESTTHTGSPTKPEEDMHVHASIVREAVTMMSLRKPTEKTWQICGRARHAGATRRE